MALKYIKTQVSNIYTDDGLHKSVRLLDEQITHDVSSYKYGEETIPGNTIDFEIASDVNYCVIVVKSLTNINIKVGNTTSTSLNGIKQFIYDGATSDIFISNPINDTIVVSFVTAKY